MINQTEALPPKGIPFEQAVSDRPMHSELLPPGLPGSACVGLAGSQEALPGTGAQRSTLPPCQAINKGVLISEDGRRWLWCEQNA